MNDPSLAMLLPANAPEGSYVFEAQPDGTLLALLVIPDEEWLPGDFMQPPSPKERHKLAA